MIKRFAIIAFMTLTAAGSSLAKEYTFPKEESFDGKGITSIKIDVPYGEIAIAKSNSESIDVFFKNTVYAGDQKEADELNRESEYKAKVVGSRLIISFDAPHGESITRSVLRGIARGKWSQDFYPMLKVSIPDGKSVDVASASAPIDASDVTIDLSIKTASSDVNLENTKGKIEIDNSSGDINVLGHVGPVSMKASSSNIRIADVVGDVDAYTASGDSNIDKVKGSLKTRSTSGDNSIYDVDGDLDVGTASGDVIVKGVKGSVRASSVSGDVDLKGLSAADGIYSIETVSGDVSLGIDPKFQGKFTFRTTSGGIRSHLEVEGETRSDNYMTGRIGQGNGHIDVSTVSGDINVGGY